MYELKRYAKALELDKVLGLLAEQAGCDDSRAMALSLEPSGDYWEAKALMDKTEAAYQMAARIGSPSLYGLKNCQASLNRAEKGASLSMGELLAVSGVLHNIRAMADYRRRWEGESNALSELFSLLKPNRSLEELIDTSILSEEEMADSASGELMSIRRKIRAAQQKIRDRLDQMIKSPAQQKFLQESIVTLRDGRYVVPVKSEHRSEVKGLVHDTSSSGATVFIEPLAVVEANNEIRLLQSQERQEMDRILQALSAQVGERAEEIRQSYDLVVELDLYFAKAALAQKMKAAVPILGQDGVVDLKRARHPLIDSGKVVPIDVRLGRDFDVLVITGPNTGGKTVALKTTGLLSMMAMIGLMIPAAEESRVSVFREILVDIGDEQSIEQSLSTFSAHMTNIVSILKHAGEGSLVLIDELGAGTDPVEGAALAVSIIEALAAQGAKVVATTHYAEIKMYALTQPRVENASCEFDVNTLRPTYRLLIGIPGRSNAFAISSRLGLPEEIIEAAKGHVSSDNVRFEDVVSQLEATRQALEAERERASSLKEREHRARMDFNTYKQRMENQMQKELEAAQTQARSIVERTRAQAQSLLDELEELRRQKDSEAFSQMVSQAKSGMRAAVRALDETASPVIQRKTDEGYTLPRPLKKGDAVRLANLGGEGVVLTVPDEKGEVLIQAGPVRTKVHESQLRLVEGKKKRPSGTVGRNVQSRAQREVKSEVDLRGMTVEEALMTLDQYIDGCLLSGVTTVTIIHGKGTGALRAAIQQHLRSHRSVRSFRLGTFGEGDAGVTIAELK